VTIGELDAFFDGYDEARPIFDALRDEIQAIGPVEMRVSKSQIAFRRRAAFAWAWIPGRYLRGGHAPLVLSVSLPYRHNSARWKEIVEPVPGRFMHHLELHAKTDIDDEVHAWLREAWNLGG
jgi:hypothetical protein